MCVVVILGNLVFVLVIYNCIDCHENKTNMINSIRQSLVQSSTVACSVGENAGKKHKLDLICYHSSSRLIESLNLAYSTFLSSAICETIDCFSCSSFSRLLHVASFISSILVSTSSLGK